MSWKAVRHSSAITRTVLSSLGCGGGQLRCRRLLELLLLLRRRRLLLRRRLLQRRRLARGRRPLLGRGGACLGEQLLEVGQFDAKLLRRERENEGSGALHVRQVVGCLRDELRRVAEARDVLQVGVELRGARL